ncbi:MAG: DUF2889 domain-containing protein [Dehalococcoidia bacterium]|nr:DUF2889 domain-containing protein [Dehalococcoidia bacterium]
MLVYSRNKLTTVEDLQDGSLRVKVTSNDTCFSLALEMSIKIPDMEIAAIKGKIVRSPYAKCSQALSILQEAVGVRIGTGLIKNINAFIANEQGCRRLADMILEGCDQVVNRFTYSTIHQGKDIKPEELRAAQIEFLKSNPQLIGSCIAYAKDSPLVKLED